MFIRFEFGVRAYRVSFLITTSFWKFGWDKDPLFQMPNERQFTDYCLSFGPFHLSVTA